MRLKTSGSDDGARSAKGGGGCGANSAPVAPAVAEADEGIGPGLPPPPLLAGVRRDPLPPHPLAAGSLPRVPPVSPVRRQAFRGLGVVGPQSGRGASAQHSDNAAAPARRASGTSTWRPGATRGGALGQLGPAEEPVWPSWLAWQQRLMPQPRLLHRAQDGAPCSKQSAPYVPLPAALRHVGRLRCGAASRTLRTGARGGLRAYGSRGGPPSRGRGK